MADFWKRFSRNRQAVLGLIILCIVIFMAAIANVIYPGDPFLYSKFPLSAPGENGFLLGSDSIGRDVASGIAHGCLLYTSPSPRDRQKSRMPSSA